MVPRSTHNGEQPADLAGHWRLDPQLSHLNHGSFGACPVPVLEEQARLRELLERDAMRFFVLEMEGLLDAARRDLASFVGSDPNSIVFVRNATEGVNTVLRSLSFSSADEILTTDHEYLACRNAIDFTAERTGASVVVADVPFPVDSPSVILEAVIRCVTPRTRFVLIDHVTSPTGLILPVQELTAKLKSRGIDVMVDGAHAPGMVPLAIEEIGAPYYTANCHKWLCAPKGAGLLYVRPDKQPGIRPMAISLWANSPRMDRSKFHMEFDWTGTADPTAWLSVPTAISFMGSLLPGSWRQLMTRNHVLAVEARRVIADALDVAVPCPDEMIGSMAAVPLPGGFPPTPTNSMPFDPVEQTLRERYGIIVPIMPAPQQKGRLVRASAQAYNTLAEYQRLAEALKEIL